MAASSLPRRLLAAPAETIPAETVLKTSSAAPVLAARAPLHFWLLFERSWLCQELFWRRAT